MKRVATRRTREIGTCAVIVFLFAQGIVSAQGSNLLVDRGFEPGSASLVSFVAPLDGRWAAEDADIVTGPDNGIYPIRDGMLRLNSTSLDASQVSQWIDVSSMAALIDDGRVAARFRALVNSPDPAANGGLILTARSGIPGTQLGSVSSTIVLDSDPNTWRHLFAGYGSHFILPAGTRAVEVQFSFDNDSIVLGAYGDEAVLELEVLWFGRPHVPLGLAVLGAGMDGSLTVSNIGSSGEDGVAIEVGQADALSVTTPFDPASMPIGSFTESREVVEIAGATQTVGYSRMERLPQGLRVNSNFSGLGASTYTLTLLNNESTVFSQTEIPDTMTFDILSAFNGKIKCKWKRCPDVNENKYWKRIWRAKGGLFDVNFDGNLFTSTTIIVEPDTTTLANFDSYAIELTAADLSEFQILEEALEAFTFDHSILGRATMEGSPDQLIVSNIGSSGEDGVDADIGQADDWSAFWQALDPSLLPTGAYMELQTNGSVNDVPDQLLGSVRIEDIGEQLQAAFDFSPLGASTYEVHVLLDGVLVDSETGLSGPSVTFDAVGCGGGGDDNPTDPHVPGKELKLVIYSPSPTPIMITGHAPVLGDEIVAVPSDGTPFIGIQHLTSFDVLAANIPQITILEESATPVCSGATGDLNNDAKIDGRDIQAFLNAILTSPTSSETCAGDFNGDGSLNLDDVSDFVAMLINC
ncbi:MAG: hypothetical protein MI923_27590 [Phycisphaerales bacterium]|nr:hypothetical protein [Phycisphaerales bacterium]